VVDPWRRAGPAAASAPRPAWRPWPAAAYRVRHCQRGPARRSARPRQRDVPTEPAEPQRGRPHPRRLQRRVWAHLPGLRRSSRPGLLPGGAAASAAPRSAPLQEGPAAYLKHRRIRWAEEGRAVSGPGEAKAGQGVSADDCCS